MTNTTQIRAYIESQGLKLGHVARVLGISSSALHQKLESVRATDPELAKKYAEVLYNQALLIAGLPLADPSGYTDLVCSLWS